jgi:predicted nicotinamide N-methyase
MIPVHYPEVLSGINEELQLWIPDPERVRVVYEERLAIDPGTPFPFWARIWPAAWELAAFLRAEPGWIKDKKVLELGAGIGLPAFAMAKQASKMIISDHAPEAVELMKKNISLLGLSHVEAICLDWNSVPEEMKADTVLLSDTNYASDQFDSLLSLIKRFLEEGSTIIMATPQRINITPFAEALTPFIRRSELYVNRQMGEPVEIRILVLAIR